MSRWPAFLRCNSVVNGNRCDRAAFHGGWHVHRAEYGTHTWGHYADRKQTYETSAPWITWTFLSYDRETRLTGRSRVQGTCCICGESETLRIRIPRVGRVPIPEGGRHATRTKWIEKHAHPDRHNPIDWAMPLRNPAAFRSGIPMTIFENVARTAQMETEFQEPGPDSGNA